MSVTHYSPEEVREIISMPEAIDCVRHSFLDFSEGHFEMPERLVLSGGNFLVMSALHRPSRSIMVKTLSLNFETRLPSILGTVTWSNQDDSLQVVADAGAVTALRTGAITGVATDLLATKEASSCAVIGAGAQSADQARAVHAVRPITLLEVVDLDLVKAERLCASLADEFGGGVEMRASTDANRAIEGKDVVCCATTSRKPLFQPDALAPHAHVNAIGSFRPSMHEIPEQVLANSFLVVDEKRAVLEESGEIIDAIASGSITIGDLTELGPALREPSEIRSRPTVFKSVGIAIQDWAIIDILARRGAR